VAKIVDAQFGKIRSNIYDNVNSDTALHCRTHIHVFIKSVDLFYGLFYFCQHFSDKWWEWNKAYSFVC